MIYTTEGYLRTHDVEKIIIYIWGLSEQTIKYFLWLSKC